ncbi:MAG: 50S ribosomal protein L21 [bacterium]
MYAVIETGGKQYKISPGDIIAVEKLDGEKGAQVEFAKVRMIADDDRISCGQDVSDAKVRATIMGETKAKKVVAFKYKRRKNSRKKIGHRQKYTSIRVDEILPGTV